MVKTVKAFSCLLLVSAISVCEAGNSINMPEMAEVSSSDRSFQIVGAVCRCHGDAVGSTGSIALKDIIAASAVYPTILSAQSEVKASESDKDAAKMQRYPSISATASTNGFSGFRPVLQVQQPLWTGGRITGQIDEATQLVSAAEAKVQELTYNVELKAVDAWASLVSSQNSISVNQALLSQLNNYRNFMERRVANKVSPRIETELVLTRIQQAEADLKTAEATEKYARVQIRQLTNYVYSDADLDNTIALDAQAAEVRTWAKQILLDNPSDFIDAAAESYPSVIGARRTVEVLKARRQIKESANYPNINLTLQHTINQDSSLKYENDDRIMLNFTYQPGAGLSSYKAYQAAVIRAEGAIASVDATKLEVLESMNADVQSLLSSMQREKMLDDSVTGGKLVLASYSRQFVAGKRSWLDVMNAVRELTQSQLAAVSTKVAIVSSAYKLKVKSGEFKKQDVLSSNE